MKGEQAREPSRTEPNRANLSRTELNRAEPSRADPSRTDPNQAKLSPPPEHHGSHLMLRQRRVQVLPVAWSLSSSSLLKQTPKSRSKRRPLVFPPQLKTFSALPSVFARPADKNRRSRRTLRSVSQDSLALKPIAFWRRPHAGTLFCTVQSRWLRFRNPNQSGLRINRI